MEAGLPRPVLLPHGIGVNSLYQLAALADRHGRITWNTTGYIPRDNLRLDPGHLSNPDYQILSYAHLDGSPAGSENTVVMRRRSSACVSVATASSGVIHATDWISPVSIPPLYPMISIR
jgi:hypothetical protein